ncbi:hypothetical protein M3Y97_00065100 [Aphelenchoides bicaudatus]|nr:hypothetical protein M3Y97_00065100 [Aphelenchoides bicaudatus]
MKKFSLKLWPRADQADPTDEPSVVDGITLGEGKRFGIRSYLHQFYLSSPTVDDLENPNAWYLLPPPPMVRASSLVCRIITLIGLLLLLAGAGFIIVGYTWKPDVNDIDSEITKIAITQDEDGDFYIDKGRLNDFIIASSLVFPTCVHFFTKSGKLPFSEDNTPNEPPVRIYPSLGSRFKVTPSKFTGQRISPTSGPVPVMQEITNIQPSGKRSGVATPTADEVLMACGDSDALLP